MTTVVATDNTSVQFLDLFKETVQQIANLFKPNTNHTSYVDSANLPQVSYGLDNTGTITISITGVPFVSARELDHSILERILNHVKDANIKGRYEDTHLRKLFNNRPFRFCLSYSFYHDKKKTLHIMFYVSRTKKAPVWVKTTNTGTSLTYMSEKEIYLFTRTLVRQCKHAIQNWVVLTYNNAISSGNTPYYYDSEFPN